MMSCGSAFCINHPFLPILHPLGISPRILGGQQLIIVGFDNPPESTSSQYASSPWLKGDGTRR
jgi:hypothetical protein